MMSATLILEGLGTKLSPFSSNLNVLSENVSLDKLIVKNWVVLEIPSPLVCGVRTGGSLPASCAKKAL